MTRHQPLVLSAADARQSAAIENGSALFIGTATVLIRFAGFTVLTDPNFLHAGERVYLGKGLWSKRRTDPAMEIDELPPLDLIVLSHLHDDHFDKPARKRLAGSAPVITTGHAAERLRSEGYVTHPLDTWDTQVVVKGGATLRVTAMPGVHSTNPLVRSLLPPVMGSMLEFELTPGRVALRIYITGDTLLYDDLREIPSRYPSIDVAFLHLGGTRVLGMLVTMNGEQGADLVQLIRPMEAVPIHYDDYTAFKSPLSDFTAAVAGRDLAGTSIVYLDRGQTHALLARQR